MSMHISLSGIQGNSEWLKVISNNVSNSGSIGYKGYSAHFSDYMYSTVPQGQIGLGSSVGFIERNTGQGTLFSTTNTSDLGINGDGYFKLLGRDSTEYYSRAGMFSFDKNGYYTDHLENHVMGFPMNADGKISSKEEIIQLPPQNTIPATPSTLANIQKNFSIDKTSSSGLLYDEYNNGIGSSFYGDSLVFSVYQPDGTREEMTVYFDKIETNSGEQQYEFIVTMNPDKDTRAFDPNSEKKGLLMTGALIFSSNGILEGMSALVPSTTPDDINSWINAPLDSKGNPQFSFSTKPGSLQNISLDFGIYSTNKNYQNTGETGLLASVLSNPELTQKPSTAFTGKGATTTVNVDGRNTGILQNILFSNDGILTAQYSNGEKIDIYQMNLYTFQASKALNDIGNSLYIFDKSVGGAIYKGIPGTNGMGTLQNGALELSNVELTDEFTNMILAQRTLEANTKTLSTIDDMLKTAIALR
ncbi:MAG: flagellar hook protein FlgE [Desulfovibrionaceae bacterium]